MRVTQLKMRLLLAIAAVVVGAFAVPQLASASSIDAWPLGLTFSTPVGTTSAVQTITVGENAENGFIYNVSVFPPFSIVGGDCPLGFPTFIGPTCTIDVAFAPGAAGTNTGNVHIDEVGFWSGGVFAKDIPLVGYAQPAPAPAVVALGSSYDFRAVRIYQPSPARTFTLLNKSSRPVYFSQPSIGPLPFYFYRYAGGSCIGMSVLGPYQSCTWNIYFQAFADFFGVPFSAPATMSVATVNAGTPSISLSGQQVALQTGAGVTAGGYSVDAGMPDLPQSRHRVEVSLRVGSNDNAAPGAKHLVYRWWSGGNEYVFRSVSEQGFNQIWSPFSLFVPTGGDVFQVTPGGEVYIGRDGPIFGFWGSNEPAAPNQFTICCGRTVPDYTGTIASPGGGISVTGVYFIPPA